MGADESKQTALASAPSLAGGLNRPKASRPSSTRSCRLSGVAPGNMSDAGCPSALSTVCREQPYTERFPLSGVRHGAPALTQQPASQHVASSWVSRRGKEHLRQAYSRPVGIL